MDLSPLACVLEEEAVGPRPLVAVDAPLAGAPLTAGVPVLPPLAGGDDVAAGGFEPLAPAGAETAVATFFTSSSFFFLSAHHF